MFEITLSCFAQRLTSVKSTNLLIILLSQWQRMCEDKLVSSEDSLISRELFSAPRLAALTALCRSRRRPPTDLTNWNSSLKFPSGSCWISRWAEPSSKFAAWCRRRPPLLQWKRKCWQARTCALTLLQHNYKYVFLTQISRWKQQERHTIFYYCT